MFGLKIPDLSPYSLAFKLAGAAIAVGALLALVMSWSSRGQTIERMTQWQNTVVIATTDATVEPDAKGKRKLLAIESVPSAIAGLKRSYDSCHGAIDTANTLALNAKTRADNADKALANQLVLFQQSYGSAEKRIEALAGRKPEATPDLQCQAVTTDSRSAWEAWK